MKISIAVPALFLLLAGHNVFLLAQTLPNSLPLMPWPRQVTVQSGLLPVDGGNFAVSLSGAGSSDPRVTDGVARFLSRLRKQTGPSTPTLGSHNANLAITVDQTGHPAPQKVGDNERYTLTVAGGHIQLNADAPLGVLRGLETLLQLVQRSEGSGAAAYSVPLLEIQDEPRFAWRGLSFDVSRHFMPVEEVKLTLDGMAAVKLNVLHWHLSDDEGFRVESKKFPRLQEVGSDGMFYTQAEVRDVVAYAASRGIRVVPEFDMPGHSTSILAAYPAIATGQGPFHVVHDHQHDRTSVMDPAKEATYEFLDGFIGEMAALFPDEYFHIGGDEVSPKGWNASPAIRAFMAEKHLPNAAALQAYFNQRVLSIVTKNGKHMIGWDEILQPDLPKSTAVQSWRGQASLWKAASAGHQAILSAGYYLDLMYPASTHYAVDPLRTAAGAPAQLTPEQSQLILGGEAAMWEELASVENIDAKLWPRLAAIAERFWSPESVTNTASMYQRLTSISQWLEGLGLKHRSNLAMMRKRLAGPQPQAPLDVFASVLEPVKGYSRHAERYGIFTPLNRLVDSIPPESDAARDFGNDVDAYLASPATSRNSADLRGRLASWSEAASNVGPILHANPLLTEDIPVADGVAALCQAAQEALQYLDAGAGAPAGWPAKTRAAVGKFVDTRVGDLLIQIAPGVRKLVDAVPPAPAVSPTRQ